MIVVIVQAIQKNGASLTKPNIKNKKRERVLKQEKREQLHSSDQFLASLVQMCARLPTHKK